MTSSWLRWLCLACVCVLSALFIGFEYAHATGYSYDLHASVLGGHTGYPLQSHKLCSGHVSAGAVVLCNVSDYDEGAYTLSAQLLDAGYALFSEVFSAQPAWFLGAIALGMRLFHDNGLAGAHLVEMLFGVVALLGVAWTARVSFGPLAALVAVAVLVLSPGFLLYAHTVEAEMPMMGLGMLAVGAVAQYARTPRWALLLLCGVMLAGAAEMKLLAIVFVVPVGLFVGLAVWLFPAPRPTVRHPLLTGRWLPWRRRPALPEAVARCQSRLAGALRALTLVGLTAFIPIVLTGILISPRDQLAQVVRFHLAASRAVDLDIAANARALWTFLQVDPALLALASVGALAGLLWSWRTALIPLVWLASSIIFMLAYHPLLDHQFAVLLPPLAILAGGAVTGLMQARGRRWVLALIPVSAGILAYVVVGPLLIARDQDLFVTTLPTPRSALGAYVAQHTNPSDFIVTDDLFVALDAHRLAPPPLDDPSNIRASAGYLTTSQMITATQDYHVQVVALFRGVYRRYPDYLQWLARNGFHLVDTGIPGATVYQRS